ncbi:MAG: protein-L-isoaspartate(D-aspartate) O-methyltransferase, partial [Arsenophonus sp. ET-DL12-MAG3]
MIKESIRDLLTQLRHQGIKNESLLSVIEKVPREHFIDEAFSHKAYENIPLPIGFSQTISQPYIVARMTELLEFSPMDHVLDIGTGSGYQTAILAHLVTHVFSVERIKELQWNAKRRLKQLNLYNVSIRHGDGWMGWASKGPFDGIIVT